MATRSIAPTIGATNLDHTSPIIAMHVRYETAWLEYNRIDDADIALDKSTDAGKSLTYRYHDAEQANTGETDALRLAILYQVPTTWLEAMILQFHIHIAFDPDDSSTDENRAAISVAIDTLLDFMCGEIDHDGLGRQFQNSARLVSNRRRFRTGQAAEA